MFGLLIISIFIFTTIREISSFQFGKIRCTMIKSNSSLIQSTDEDCTNCLCDCKDSNTCSGINCFPTNRTCQFINENNHSWILESDLIINTSSKNFFAIKPNLTRFCSCYTLSKILSYYSQMNQSLATNTINMRSVKYISTDDTLIALNDSIIRKLSAQNLSRILVTLDVPSGYATSVLCNDTNIYIAFAGNRSINMYDLNLKYLQKFYSTNAGILGGMFVRDNQLLVVDVQKSVLWLTQSVSSNKFSLFFNFSSFNIQFPTSLFIYQDQYLFISSTSSHLHVFFLANFTLKETYSLPANISFQFMRHDDNCQRLWFGTNSYRYAPVFDLTTNQMNIYSTQGFISQYGIYSIDFNGDYTSFYANSNGNLGQLSLSKLIC